MARNVPTHHLLTVAGKTPATVTEALWGLAVDRNVPVGRLIVLTTAEAGDVLASALPDAIEAMRRDYPDALAALRFDPARDLRVACTQRGAMLPDIRNSRENEALANWILRQAIEACANPDVTVHASIAGGRKTMSFFLGTVMQLVGRAQDRLYHVLVPTEYELAGFLYPTPRDCMIERRGAKPINARRAKVDMAELPFVRLGPTMKSFATNDELLQLSFSDLVKRTESALLGAKLHVVVRWDLGKHTDGMHIDFVRTYPSKGDPLLRLPFRGVGTYDFVYYSYLLYWRSRDEKAPEGAPPTPVFLADPHEFAKNLEDLQRWIERLARSGRAFHLEDSALYKRICDVQKELESGASPEDTWATWLRCDVREKISRLRERIVREIKKKIPHEDPTHYLVHPLARRRPSDLDTGRYWVNIPPSHIHFDPDLD